MLCSPVAATEHKIILCTFTSVPALTCGPGRVSHRPPYLAEWLEVAHNSSLLCLWGAIALAMLGQASGRDHDDGSGGSSGPSSAAIRQVRSASDTVSVSVENGALVVNVIINGQGPFPMMFDTGGVEAITPETATALGLSVEGEGTARGSGEHTVSVALTHLKGLRLGGAELSDIALPIIPLPRFIADRGNRARLAGLIGFGVLNRFAVRLSYDDQTLTLNSGARFSVQRERATRTSLLR